MCVFLSVVGSLNSRLAFVCSFYEVLGLLIVLDIFFVFYYVCC